MTVDRAPVGDVDTAGLVHGLAVGDSAPGVGKKSGKTKEMVFLIISAAFLAFGIFQLLYFSTTPVEISRAAPALLVMMLIVAIKYLADLWMMGLGFSALTLTLIFFPLVSSTYFAPLDQVQNALNPETGMIQKHAVFVGSVLIYFYSAWSFLLHFAGMRGDVFDKPFIDRLVESRKEHRIPASVFFSLVAVAAVVIYRPFLPGGVYDLTRPSLLPGNAWQYVSLIAYIFAFSSRGNVLSIICLIAVPLWLIMHYARADVMSLFLGIYLIVATSRNKKRNVFYPSLAFLALGLFFGIVMSYIGLVRHDGWGFRAETLVQAMTSVLNYPTVQDAVYSSAVTVEVVQYHGTFDTFLWVLRDILPSFIVGRSEARDPAIFIGTFFHTNNGLLVPIEFYLNYLVVGVIVGPFALFSLYLVTLRVFKVFDHRCNNHLASALCYLILITTAPRVFWYGITYFIKPLVIVFIPLLLIYMALIYPYRRGRSLNNGAELTGIGKDGL